MRVLNLRQETSLDGCRAVADVVWEKTSRPPQTIFVEFEGNLAGELEISGDAFLSGCLVPALKNGETRIRIEGSVCPRLRDGSAVVAGLLRSWYGDPRGGIEIEAEGGFQPRPVAGGGALSFLTGGVDSTFTLLSNHRAFALNHPGRIRECVLVSSLFSGEAASPDLAREFDDRVRLSAAGVARQAGVPLLIVRTNLRELEPGFDFFARESHSSILASVAHLLSRRGTAVHLAASADIRHLIACGTHPLLDTSFSSSRLEILHDGFGFSRLEKVGALVQWRSGLEHLMVCQAGPVGGGYLNCGECEKCRRTLVALAVFDAVGGAASFRSRDVSPKAIVRGRVDPESGFHWSCVQEALRSQGRPALARAIGFKLLTSRLIPLRRVLDPERYGRRGISSRDQG
jgi:hypothetical protein